MTLEETDDLKLRKNVPNNFETFRADRDTPTKECGGGVMLIIPSTLNPNVRNDLNYMNKTNFESLLIECSVNNNSCNKQKQLINVSYNPNKSLYHQILEELSVSIDHAIVENKPLTIMGDYNLSTRGKEDLETLILSYGLIVSKTDQPTRLKATSKTLIDYIITDHSNAAFFTAIVSDTPLRTIGKKPIDHLATSVITNIQMMKTTNVFKKTIFDKKTYNKKHFQYYVRNCDWEYFYGQSCAEGLFSIFSNYIENSLNKEILKKTIFIRKDKSNLTLHQKWVMEKTKQHYKQIHQSMNPSDAKYKLFQSNFIESLNSDRNDYLTMFVLIYQMIEKNGFL